MYAELHVKTNFSFLEGASHPDELVGRAAELGYAALAVTDRQSLAGVVRAHMAAKEAGLKLLVGAEITPDDGLPLVLLPTDRASYGRLARLLTRGRLRAEKGQCRLVQSELAEAAEGLIACVIPQNSPLLSGEGQGVRGPALLDSVRLYRELFGDRCYLLAEVHRGPDDRQWLQRLVDLSRRLRVPLAAGGDVHYHDAGRKALHDVLTATRLGTTVAGAAGHLFPNAQRHLKTPGEMAAALAAAPGTVERTREIADRVGFSLDQLRYEYPRELAPEGESPIHYLARLAWAGARKRYPRGVPEKVRGLLEHELRLIEELHYEAYFLTVWDLVRYARRRGILCQGRGSAANSAVCYCLGVTAVDPERMDMLFERFVSRERNEAPDIDVDFEHQRREEVLQYLYRKYGRDRAGMTAEVITYRPRSAIRDVGKALGLSLDRIDRLAKSVEHFREEPQLALRCREAGIDPEGPLGLQLVDLVGQLIGFPRHLSQHTGGMVITQGPLCELVPIENAAMPRRTVIQWNKDDLDELGILKVDCLALGMLTAVRRCFDLVRKHYGRPLTLAAIPEGDEEVYAMIRRADTMGVFQIESRAQMSMLPRIGPRSFYDLVIEVAIVRPGPIQGNMVHPYLRRRNGEEPVTYPNEAVRRVLEKTLGVPLFQEQAMRLAVVAAGFTPGEADQLRRAMAAWRRPGLIEQFRRKLIDGMLARGMPPEYAEATFQQIRGFGDYGFPESHAASFALLVYVSAWLKCHYPAAFCAALLNSQPMGFYAPPQLVRDARQHGVEVRPADVNHSGYECTLEAFECSRHTPCAVADGTRHVPTTVTPALRLGLDMLRGMGEAPAEQIVEARGGRPFGSLEDFAKRTGLGRTVALRLAKAGAFGSLGLSRRGALWHALAHDPKDRPQDRPLLAGLEADGQTPVEIPPLSPAEEVLADYRTTGLSLTAHPLEFLREGLDRLGVAPARQLATLPNGGPVRVAGIVLVRQRPGTAKGITFVTLEDETGVANLVIRPDVWQRFRQAALGAAVLVAQGRLERHGQVIHVLVGRLEDLSQRLAELGSQSRDFC
jgi:error-prone DNA polymerase